MTKLYVLVENAPIKIHVSIRQFNTANESQSRLKRNRSVDSKNRNRQIRKETKRKYDPNEDIITLKASYDIIDILVLEYTNHVYVIYEYKEISLNYVTNKIQWNKHEVSVDDLFEYNTTLNVINNNENQEPIKYSRQIENWQKWKNTHETKLNSLNKINVF